MPIFETKRLILREFAMEDAALLFRYSQEDMAKKELPDEVLDSVEAARDKIRMFMSKYSHDYPLVYAVALREGGPLIGHISLSPIPEGIEVGYAIAADYQGKGYAKEIVKPFAQWAKARAGISVLYGLAKADNTASWMVLESAGFQLRRVEVRNFWGDRFPFKVYCI